MPISLQRYTFCICSLHMIRLVGWVASHSPWLHALRMSWHTSCGFNMCC